VGSRLARGAVRGACSLPPRARTRAASFSALAAAFLPPSAAGAAAAAAAAAARSSALAFLASFKARLASCAGGGTAAGSAQPPSPAAPARPPTRSRNHATTTTARHRPRLLSPPWPSSPGRPARRRPAARRPARGARPPSRAGAADREGCRGRRRREDWGRRDSPAVAVLGAGSCDTPPAVAPPFLHRPSAYGRTRPRPRRPGVVGVRGEVRARGAPAAGGWRRRALIGMDASRP